LSYSVQIKEQVRAFQATLGPESRRDLKRAILRLADEAGDIKALRDNLAGYYRLRVGRYRVVFRYLPGRVVDCVYLNERSLVYEIFESEMTRILGRE
jgi:mRNA interferase RelE/StbE